jgi:DNA transposition AAA+ family ATPase
MTLRIFPDRTTPDGRPDINVLALVKGSERYVILYDDASKAEALRQLARWASNPGLSLNWWDAAHMGKKIRKVNDK